MIFRQRNIHKLVFSSLSKLKEQNSLFRSKQKKRTSLWIVALTQLPPIDLHPHAASLPRHAAAKSGDPPIPGDHAPQREKDGYQQSGWRILHPQARFLHLVPQAQQVRPDTLFSCRCVYSICACAWLYMVRCYGQQVQQHIIVWMLVWTNTHWHSILKTSYLCCNYTV